MIPGRASFARDTSALRWDTTRSMFRNLLISEIIVWVLKFLFLAIGGQDGPSSLLFPFPRHKGPWRRFKKHGTWSETCVPIFSDSVAPPPSCGAQSVRPPRGLLARPPCSFPLPSWVPVSSSISLWQSSIPLSAPLDVPLRCHHRVPLEDEDFLFPQRSSSARPYISEIDKPEFLLMETVWSVVGDGTGVNCPECPLTSFPPSYVGPRDELPCPRH